MVKVSDAYVDLSNPFTLATNSWTIPWPTPNEWTTNITAKWRIKINQKLWPASNMWDSYYTTTVRINNWSNEQIWYTYISVWSNATHSKTFNNLTSPCSIRIQWKSSQYWMNFVTTILQVWVLKIPDKEWKPRTLNTLWEICNLTTIWRHIDWTWIS